MKLSEELGKWRIDRPDEWKMDEFRRKAEKLEAERDALATSLRNLLFACSSVYSSSQCFAEAKTAAQGTLRTFTAKVLQGGAE
jgi:hypothetical protein